MSPFTDRVEASIASLGETRLIETIRDWLGDATPRTPAGIGDDCAVMAGSPRRQLITVDPVIYGEHFDDSVSAQGAGQKLFKRNLSDIAAMGGRPRAAVVALALDRSVKVSWLRAFYRALADMARQYRVPVIGGDIAHLRSGFVATLTLVGEAVTDRLLTRTGARRGDWIYVTGQLGGSLLGHHWQFAPRLTEGAWLAGRKEVRALMDVSDGLAKDIFSLTPEDAVPVIWADAVPMSRAAQKRSRQTAQPALLHAVSDGEDYELLFAVADRSDRKAFERAWRRRFAVELTCIGRFMTPSDAAEEPRRLRLEDYHGYEHLG